MSINSISGSTSLATSGVGLYTGQSAASAETEAASVRTDTYEARRTAEDAASEGTIYKPNAALARQMELDLENQKASLLKTVRDMLAKQGITVAKGNGAWKQLEEGGYEVDKETQAAAQAAISDGGYWSVEKTSERLITYAKALTGGDPSKAEDMRAAFIQGYKEAEKAWGGALPEISQKTYDATMKLFDEWAKEGQSGSTLPA